MLKMKKEILQLSNSARYSCISFYQTFSITETLLQQWIYEFSFRLHSNLDNWYNMRITYHTMSDTSSQHPTIKQYTWQISYYALSDKVLNLINPFRPDFHTCFWYLKRFYDGLKGLHKTFWGTTNKCENKKLS